MTGYFDASIARAFAEWEQRDADSDPANAQPCPSCGPNADDGEHSMYVRRDHRRRPVSWTCCLCERTDIHESWED